MEKTIQKMATRDAYAKALLTLGEERPDVVVLDADLAKSTRTEKFGKKFPDRFFDMGIAEANMMGTAAGLATCGKLVFASTFAIFATGRAWEQVRNSICYANLNVKIVATHGGISVGPDGASHQSVEDIAIMRAIPNMAVIVPADGIETEKAILAISEREGPAYVRLTRGATPVIFSEDYVFELGKAVTLTEGNDLAIVATGTMVFPALEAANELEQKGIHARLISMSTIKPLDEEVIIKAARETRALLTAEEHSIIGGLGGAVCEVVCAHCPVPVIRIGVKDRFGQSGDEKELMAEYGLTAADIVEAARKLLAMKNALGGHK